MIPRNNLAPSRSQAMHWKKRRNILYFLVSILIFLHLGLFALAADDHLETPIDLTLLPLEELVRVKVTTVSKKPEQLFDSASAVYVITGDDIRRSGYTTIAEALRLAPGMQVARLGSSQWAISTRGFAGLYANKLLVLIDGRSVYSPLNSGVHWDTVDTLLEDVDRIEVVRGPGGTLWGANAVNGVVNIITKSAKETQGIYAEAGGGTLERAFAGFRYGGNAGDVFYRVYANYFDRAEFETANGNSFDDDWQKAQAGFRLDWESSIENMFTLQGDVYSGMEDSILEDAKVRGGNLLGRWTHDFSLDAQSKFQVYYDRSVREVFAELDIQTFDVEFQHRFVAGERHEFVFGGGYRLIDDDLEGTPVSRYRTEERTVHLPSAFLQDEITLAPDLVRLTLGTKVEHHYFSGWEIQPNARLLWTPHENHTVWTAVSRAVRTPSRAENDVRATFAVVPGPTNTVYASNMRGRADSETVLAYELGYRIQPLPEISFDLAGFYNVYDKFATFEPATPFLETTASATNLIVPFEVRNKAHGETYGAELAAHWQAADWWRLNASYSYLQIQLHAPNSREVSAEFAERESPHHEVALRSSMNCAYDTELDCIVRYVDAIPGFNVASYVTMDLRFAWKPSPNWEFAIVGQNLFDEGHREFGDVATVRQQAAEVPRSFYGKLTCRF